MTFDNVFWQLVVSNAAGAGIGALAAFLFTIWITRLQARRDIERQDREERARNLAALRRVIDSCMQTMEETTNWKRQIIVALKAETEEIRKGLSSGLSLQGLDALIQRKGTFFKF